MGRYSKYQSGQENAVQSSVRQPRQCMTPCSTVRQSMSPLTSSAVS